MLISQGLKCSRLACALWDATHVLLHLWKTSCTQDIISTYWEVSVHMLLNIVSKNVILCLFNSFALQKTLFHVSFWLEIPSNVRLTNVVFFGNTVFVGWVLLSVEPVVLSPEGYGCAHVVCLFSAGLRRKLRLTLSVHWSTCRMIYM